MCVSRNRDGITVTLRANCLNQFSALSTSSDRRLITSREAPYIFEPFRPVEDAFVYIEPDWKSLLPMCQEAE